MKRILRKYGYPPDMQARATETVIAQAKLMADDLVFKKEAREYRIPEDKEYLSMAAEPD